MPFENEFASYEPLRRILDSEKVQGITDRLKVNHIDKIDCEEKLPFVFKSSDANTFSPDLVLAIDGSYHQEMVVNGFPLAEFGYITVASVLILVEKIRQLEEQEFITPASYRETEKAASVDSVIPGCNVILDDDESASVSMRKQLYNELKNCTVFQDGETLLETYEALLSQRPEGRSPKCPYEGCDADIPVKSGEYECPACGRKLYSSDALRIHELMNNNGSCGEMYGQIMFVLERLWLIHILRAFEQKGWLATLRRMVFILDGPLAVYSTSAWLTKPIIKELERINELSKRINNEDMMILGIEKSGTFTSHFEALDIFSEGSRGKFPCGASLLLSDSYIKSNIIFSQSSKPYGIDTYFARKLFYKTSHGQRLTVNVAVYNDMQRNTETSEAKQYPRLQDVMAVLDTLISVQYENAVMPLITAHAEASIPLNLGRRIFEDIAREIRDRS